MWLFRARCVEVHRRLGLCAYGIDMKWRAGPCLSIIATSLILPACNGFGRRKWRRVLRLSRDPSPSPGRDMLMSNPAQMFPRRPMVYHETHLWILSLAQWPMAI